ncbi:type II secretion system F family protein [Candidatus Woesearchaeota archaeon]|nr:type II secretion system F family protein [Candidatus Woesearchaeota archaeon]
MYRLFAQLIPEKLQRRYEELLFFCNIKVSPAKFVGFVLSFGLGLAIAIAFDLAFIFKTPFWLTFIVSFFCIELFIYMWLVLHADSRAAFIELMLPDALQLMASNLRAGMTTDKALLLSSRPEFGPLKEELDIIAKEVVIGKDLVEALLNMIKRVKSEKLKKAVLLIVSGLRAGGELASLLTQTANNLRQQKFVEDRIKSSVLTYVIFIFAAVAVGAPLLFGLSSFLVEILTNVLASVEMPETTFSASLPIKLTKVGITPDFVINYAITSLIATSILASLTIGSIRHGKEKEGAKLIPIMILVTITVFFLVRIAISSMIGGLFEF